jgi:alcohol dehydrogenase
MLGATHACANPLTARHGTTHGVAIGVMLPHVVRWNGAVVADRYAELLAIANFTADNAPGEALARELSAMARAGGLPSSLRELGVSRDDLGPLADDAAAQWTGTFNPRRFDRGAALFLYERAY